MIDGSTNVRPNSSWVSISKWPGLRQGRHLCRTAFHIFEALGHDGDTLQRALMLRQDAHTDHCLKPSIETWDWFEAAPRGNRVRETSV